MNIEWGSGLITHVNIEWGSGLITHVDIFKLFSLVV